MKNLVRTGLMGLIFAPLIEGVAIGGVPAYDQASGISADSWRALQESSQSGSYEDLNSSWGRARRGASRGFDSGRSSNLSGWTYYISTPTLRKCAVWRP